MDRHPGCGGLGRAARYGGGYAKRILREELNMKVKINTHGNALPEVHGEWIDLCTAEDVTLDFLEYKIISLGVSIEIPAG